MKCSLSFFLLMIATMGLAQNKVVETLNPQKCPNVRIKVPSQLIEHKAWEEGGVRIDITIDVNLPKVILDKLIEVGRYKLKGEKVEDDYFVSAPNMDIPLFVGENALKESIGIKVTTPQYFAMSNNNLYKDVDEDQIRGRSDTREEIEAIIKRMKEIREDLNIHIEIRSTAKDQSADLATFLLGIKGQQVTVDQLAFPAFDE